jgi:hypothetical protein
MRKNIIMLITAALLCIAGVANADEVVQPAPVTLTNPHPVRVGFGMDLGAPSGIAVGVVVHPATDYLSLQASFTENILSPGGRLAIKVDPFAFAPRVPIGLFFDLQGGFTGIGNVPIHSVTLPGVGYDYLNFYGGLRLGRVNGFHWLFEVGPSYIHVNTSNFQAVVASSSNTTGLTLGNPSGNAWVTPTFITGFEVVWR